MEPGGVDNNVWVVGDDHEAVDIDAAHDAEAIACAVGDRRLTAIMCTHAHDHVDTAPISPKPPEHPSGPSHHGCGCGCGCGGDHLAPGRVCRPGPQLIFQHQVTNWQRVVRVDRSAELSGAQVSKGM